MSRLARAAWTAATAAIVAPTAYLAVLTVAAQTGHRAARSGPGRGRTRFVILIPAHDEERLLPSTLASVAALDYPAELVEVHVVADHCTDRTAEVARAHGAIVHERDDPEPRGKGPALSGLLDELRRTEGLGDAVVFLDADTSLDRGFLAAAEAVLDRGATVVQGHYAVRDADSAPIVAFRAAAMSSRTFLRPLGRMTIGGSAGLHGTGMVFRPPVLADRRWSSHLTEDVELHLDLLLDGVLVAFAPDARVEAEMPATLEASRSQHERWERGRIEIARRYLPRLLAQVVGDGPAGRIAAADAAADQLVPPLSVLIAGSVAWGAAATGRAITGVRDHRARRLALIAGVALCQGVHVLAALRLAGAPRSVYRSLLGAPRLVAWKLALWFRVLARPNGVRWVRTRRE